MSASVVERTGAVTFKGNPLTAQGPELKVGDPAPDFKVLAADLSEVTLATTGNRVRLFNVVPSLDTPICAEQTRRFNQELAKLPASIGVYAVSADLPFAQKRFCGENAIERIQALSDHRELAFGRAWGVAIKELRLLSRSVFVLDADGKIAYREYVREIASHPDYEAALAALRRLAT